MNPEHIKPELFAPLVINEGKNALVLIQLTSCSLCDRSMIKLERSEMQRLRNLFPYYRGANLEAQLEKADITWYGNAKDKHDHWICEDCSKKGFGSFICDLCGETRSSDLKEESFGDPPDYLCKVCYESVPAKVWDEKTSKLYREHRYDFE